jgi:hypothetical protein
MPQPQRNAHPAAIEQASSHGPAVKLVTHSPNLDRQMAGTSTTQLFNPRSLIQRFIPLPRLAKVSSQQRRCGRSSTREPFAATDRQQQGTNPITNRPTIKIYSKKNNQ